MKPYIDDHDNLVAVGGRVTVVELAPHLRSASAADRDLPARQVTLGNALYIRETLDQLMRETRGGGRSRAEAVFWCWQWALCRACCREGREGACVKMVHANREVVLKKAAPRRQRMPRTPERWSSENPPENGSDSAQHCIVPALFLVLDSSPEVASGSG